jgi:hypothetical protein
MPSANERRVCFFFCDCCWDDDVDDEVEEEGLFTPEVAEELMGVELVLASENGEEGEFDEFSIDAVVADPPPSLLLLLEKPIIDMT